jgi:hypothetical protein
MSELVGKGVCCVFNTAFDLTGIHLQIERGREERQVILGKLVQQRTDHHTISFKTDSDSNKDKNQKRIIVPWRSLKSLGELHLRQVKKTL